MTQTSTGSNSLVLNNNRSAGLTSSHILEAKHLIQRQRGQLKDDIAGRYIRQ